MHLEVLKASQESITLENRSRSNKIRLMPPNQPDSSFLVHLRKLALSHLLCGILCDRVKSPNDLKGFKRIKHAQRSEEKKITALNIFFLFSLVKFLLTSKADCCWKFLTLNSFQKMHLEILKASQDIKLHQCPRFVLHYHHQSSFLHYVNWFLFKFWIFSFNVEYTM